MTGILSLWSDNGEERVTLTCSADLLELSERYLSESDKLREVCPPLFSVSMTLNFSEQDASSIDVRATSAEQAAILHRLRPFVLSKEELFLPTYLNAIKRENRNEAVQRAANFIRDVFILRASHMLIEIDGQRINLEDRWQQYVNAFEYHRDADKQQNLRAGSTLTPYLFWTGVADKVRVLLQVRGLAALICGKQQEFSIKMVSSAT